MLLAVLRFLPALNVEFRSRRAGAKRETPAVNAHHTVLGGLLAVQRRLPALDAEAK